MRPERSDEPISNTSRESIAPGTDLHGHYLRHVNPRNRSPAQREDDCDAEQEEYSCDAEAVLGILDVDLGIYDRFASERNSDGDCTPDERLAATDTIDHEDDEDEVGERAYAVVYAGDEKLAIAFDTEGSVHAGLVVSNNVWVVLVCFPYSLIGLAGICF